MGGGDPGGEAESHGAGGGEPLGGGDPGGRAESHGAWRGACRGLKSLWGEATLERRPSRAGEPAEPGEVGPQAQKRPGILRLC